MDFDEHDDDDEMAPMPVSSSYEVPVQLGGGGVPKPGGDSGGGGRLAIAGSGGVGGAGGVRYRECLKNHAVGIGGHAVDGCGEFMAAGEEGSIDALRCAACGCHRNFHRKESDSHTGAEAAGVSSTAITAYGALPPSHHQFSPYYRSPAGPMVMGSMLGMPFGSAGPSGSGSGSGKKRFRTRFSQEQKDKMQAFAERLGWRIQKHDEAAVQQFCEEVGVKRHVLKVWMHNNKHTLGKKP
ncbi:zinc-finger homeodomain protein 2-like isoform X3 [Lolium rigidum]|uniref:zinc-finger homeodomain protein 2-like isoform X3 n=1 Tax=Lolium rigidum TaxID=89674 RepID=UPI001F5D4983|nr:zinc-finger homeodomain protein 2-like isoform X3 [Lolium rigidum]